MILRMNKNSYGQFETSVSLKAVVKVLYGESAKLATASKRVESEEEQRECDYERQLYESLKYGLKSLHFVFVTQEGNCLRTDRFWSIKQTASCLGPVAVHALGGLKQVNERNIEAEVMQMMKPLQKKIEIENNFKGNKAVNLRDIINAEAMLHVKFNAANDVVSDTDSTTHHSDVCSHMTMDEHLLEHCFDQESDAEIGSQMSEIDIDNLKFDTKVAAKLQPEVPMQFQGSSNKWQKKRN